jgi:hypothetical protein
VHADDVGARAAARHGVDGVRITEGREKGGGREWQRGAWLGGCDSSETGPQP